MTTRTYDMPTITDQARRPPPSRGTRCSRRAASRRASFRNTGTSATPPPRCRVSPTTRWACRERPPGTFGLRDENTPGLRHLAFAVEDIDAVVAGLRARGAELVGELERYEDSYRLCYVRGAEGIIVELAEPIG